MLHKIKFKIMFTMCLYTREKKPSEPLIAVLGKVFKIQAS